MLHPSYSDLMKVVNSGVEEGETPVVNSRYSIVLATSKRARQIIAGDEPLIEKEEGRKALSYAIEELETGKIQILSSREVEALKEDGEVFPTDEFVNDVDEVFDENMIEEFDEPIPEEIGEESIEEIMQEPIEEIMEEPIEEIMEEPIEEIMEEPIEEIIEEPIEKITEVEE